MSFDVKLARPRTSATGTALLQVYGRLVQNLQLGGLCHRGGRYEGLFLFRRKENVCRTYLFQLRHSKDVEF